MGDQSRLGRGRCSYKSCKIPVAEKRGLQITGMRWGKKKKLYYSDEDGNADAEPDPMRISLKKEKIGKFYVENIRLFVLM